MNAARILAFTTALGVGLPAAAQAPVCPAYELWRGGDDALTTKWADALGFATQQHGASINDPRPIRISVEPARDMGEGKFRSAIKRVWFENGTAVREKTLFAMTCAEADLAGCAAIATPRLCEALLAAPAPAKPPRAQKGDAHADVPR